MLWPVAVTVLLAGLHPRPAQSADPLYPEIGEGESLLNFADWPAEAPYKETPEAPIDPWHLVLQSFAGKSCKMAAGKQYSCAVAAAKSLAYPGAAISLADCRRWCEEGESVGADTDRIEWFESPVCAWEETVAAVGASPATGTCTLEACTAPTLVGTSGYAAAVCIQNSDFAYNSPLWDTTKDDALAMFESDPVGGNSANDGTGLDVGTPVAPGGACRSKARTTPEELRTDESEAPNCWARRHTKTTAAGNRLTEKYVTQLVTHVRVIMGSSDKTYAVTPSMAGRYTLAELVTSAMGSVASEYDVDNAFASVRGQQAPWLEPFDSGIVACDHVGFNYLSNAGVGGNVGQGPRPSASIGYRTARARIGVVSSDEQDVPCKTRNYAQGVGLDVNGGEGAWACPGGGGNCGGRVNSGQVSQDKHSAQFRRAEVWVASTLVREYRERTSAFRQFGDESLGRGFMTFRQQRQRHESGIYDTPWNPRYTFSLWYRVRRPYDGSHWHSASRNGYVLSKGDDDNRAPRLVLDRLSGYMKGNYHTRVGQINWDARQGMGRSLDWSITTTTELEDGRVTQALPNRVRWYGDYVPGGSDGYVDNVQLTFGRWHHLAFTADKHQYTAFLDGRVQYSK